jgi:hypothetical protein
LKELNEEDGSSDSESENQQHQDAKQSPSSPAATYRKPSESKNDGTNEKKVVIDPSAKSNDPEEQSTPKMKRQNRRVSVYSAPKNKKKLSIFIDLVHSLHYFGEEGPLEYVGTGSNKFTPLAKCTMVAGDVNKISKEELKKREAEGPVPLGQSSNARKGAEWNPSTSKVNPTRKVIPGNNFSTANAQVSANVEKGCEVIFVSLFDVQQNFKNMLEWSPWTQMSEVAVSTYYKGMRMKKNWLKLRRREMDKLVKERFRNPNLNIKEVRKKASEELMTVTRGNVEDIPALMNTRQKIVSKPIRWKV